MGEPYRTAILLRYYQGLEPAEIARTLNAPAGTVRWRISEGRARLRASLAARLETRPERLYRALAPILSLPTTRPLAQGAWMIMSIKKKIHEEGGCANRDPSGDPASRPGGGARH